MKAKRCSRCHKTKPLDEFHKSKARNDGRNAYCKPCVKKISRKYRAAKGIPERKRFSYNENNRVVGGVKEKCCTKCRKWKSLSGFNKNRNSKNGILSQCRICTKAWGKKYRTVCGNDQNFMDRRQIYALKYYNKQHKTLVGYLRHICQKIKQRCDNPDNDNYDQYGGIGTKYLFKSIKAFTNHIINDLKYDTLEKLNGLRLARIDKTGNYEPGNIRFITIDQCAHGNRKQRTWNFNKCSSKYKGVSYRKDRKKWRAYIKHNGRYEHLGHFTSEIEAAKVYDRKALEYYGEFALTNVMMGLL